MFKMNARYLPFSQTSGIFNRLVQRRCAYCLMERCNFCDDLLCWGRHCCEISIWSIPIQATVALRSHYASTYLCWICEALTLSRNEHYNTGSKHHMIERGDNYQATVLVWADPRPASPIWEFLLRGFGLANGFLSHSFPYFL